MLCIVAEDSRVNVLLHQALTWQLQVVPLLHKPFGLWTLEQRTSSVWGNIQLI